MKNFYLLILILAFFCCENVSTEKQIKIDLINNYEFILNGKKHVIQEFEEVFRKKNDELMNMDKKKYNITLRVSQGVDMKTVIIAKNQFMLVRDNINELIYSHE